MKSYKKLELKHFVPIAIIIPQVTTTFYLAIIFEITLN